MNDHPGPPVLARTRPGTPVCLLTGHTADNLLAAPEHVSRLSEEAWQADDLSVDQGTGLAETIHQRMRAGRAQRHHVAPGLKLVGVAGPAGGIQSALQLAGVRIQFHDPDLGFLAVRAESHLGSDDGLAIRGDKDRGNGVEVRLLGVGRGVAPPRPAVSPVPRRGHS